MISNTKFEQLIMLTKSYRSNMSLWVFGVPFLLINFISKTRIESNLASV